MHKVTPVPSCLADSSEASANLPAKASQGAIESGEAYRRVRRSAAMIGLAISMSASGMLLPNRTNSAIAAESVASEPTIANIPSPEPVDQGTLQIQVAAKPSSTPTEAPASEKAKLAAPLIKHEVKEGESLWQLSQDYQVAPEAIAASNKIAPKANLLVGQTLKIPSGEGIVHETKQNETVETLSQSYGVQPTQLQVPRPIQSSEQLPAKESVVIPGKVDTLLQHRQNNSLTQLKTSRQQLRASLAELRTEESSLKSNLSLVPTEVPSVNQQSQVLLPPTNSVQQSNLTASSSELNGTKAIEIPVPKPENSISSTSDRQENARLNRPLPIAVPSSENINRSAPSLAVPLPQATALSAPRNPQLEQTEPSAANQQEQVLERAAIPNSGSQETRITQPTAINNLQELPVKPVSPSFNLPEPRVMPTPATSNKVYQVQPGDTLNSIARRHGLSISKLIKANGINNPNLIKVNQSLVIPTTSLAAHPSMPKVLTGISLAASQTLTEPSQKVDNPQSIEIASISTIPVGGAISDDQKSQLSQPTQTNNAREVPVQSPPNFYTAQLKADVAQLQQEYQNQPEGNLEATTDAVQPVASAINIPVALPEQSVNPEWDNGVNNSRQRYSSNQNQPQLPIYPSSRRGTLPASRTQEQLVGAAPIEVQQYNPMLQTPVGETVSPELPPLSVPDQYLPDSSTPFNGYIWPTKGVLTSGYGWRWGRMHKGIDVAAPIGTPIMAAASGEVISAGWNSGGYGNLVKVRHSDGSVTLYAHNSRILVRQGQRVEQGQQISEMGSTGFSTGPHLHFEIHPGGKGAVNPVAYLPPRQRR